MDALNLGICPHALLGGRLTDWVLLGVQVHKTSGVLLRVRPFWSFRALRAAYGSLQAAYVDAAHAASLVPRGFTPVAAAQAQDEVVFIGREGKIGAPEAIAGKALAFVPRTLAGCLGLETLARRGIRPRWPVKCDRWLQVVRAVREGRADAGVLPGEVFWGLSGLARRGLQQVGRPVAAPAGHVLMVQRHDPQAVQRLQEALLAAGDTAEARLLLARLGVVSWLRPDDVLPRVRPLLAACRA